MIRQITKQQTIRKNMKLLIVVKNPLMSIWLNMINLLAHRILKQISVNMINLQVHPILTQISVNMIQKVLIVP